MKLKHILLLFLLSIGIISCEKDKEEPIPTRTVLVYIVQSNLGSYLNANIEQMVDAASKKNLNGGNLIVFYSKSQKEAELFQIKEGNGGIITKHHLKDYQNESAISPEFMRKLVQSVFADFPAQNYGMILSSHGTSWLPGNHGSLRSFGEEGGKNMEIYDLASALQGIPLEFLAFDACSMGGIECVYELKDVADYVISSPSETMAAGFPYKTILPYFFTTTPDYKGIVKGFHDYYTEYKDPFGNLAVIKTDQMDNLARVTAEIISSAGLESMYTLPLNDLQVLSYLPSSNTKLYDFEDTMNRLADNEQKSRLKDALDKAVIEKASTELIYCSRDMKKYTVFTFSGLSIYPLQEKLPALNNWYQTNLSWYTAVYP